MNIPATMTACGEKQDRTILNPWVIHAWGLMETETGILVSMVDKNSILE